MKVAIINYGMGNLGSVSRAFTELGAEPQIVEAPERLVEADRIVLPGVGSFSDGIAHLHARGWGDAVRAQVLGGKPLLGICLGMHLLASRGTEGGETAGLDLIPGEVRRLDDFGCKQRIPHVGWNDVHLSNSASGLFSGIPDGTDFYFVHSYVFQAADAGHIVAGASYGIAFAAAIERGNVFGTQFHPEKSSKAGFRLLKNFLDLRPC